MLIPLHAFCVLIVFIKIANTSLITFYGSIPSSYGNKSH